MARRDHLLGRPPGEDVRDVRRAPGLLHARDAREHLAGERDRIGDGVELLQAPVARAAAGTVVGLAEILDQRAMPAAGAGGIALHVAEQRARALAPLAIGFEHLLPADE